MASTGRFVVLIPIAAGLSITRYHLYDVERILAQTMTHVLLSLLLIGTYGLIAWFGARGAQRWSTSPAIAATVGALAVAAIAAPARRAIQDLIDRRFNRRRYDAVRLVGAELADERAGRDLAELFRRTFDDPSVAVAYPGARADTWVTDTGLAPREMADWVDVARHGRIVASWSYIPPPTSTGVLSPYWPGCVADTTMHGSREPWDETQDRGCAARRRGDAQQALGRWSAVRRGGLVVDPDHVPAVGRDHGESADPGVQLPAPVSDAD